MEKLDDPDTTFYWDYSLHHPGHPLLPEQLLGTSINPNSVAIRRCSRNFNAYISNICGALKF
ncbi:MAG: hypothetical protein NUV63_05040, partial [Gallionella sp.]|nr:hypothetical protein [Gallionella sp.]